MKRRRLTRREASFLTKERVVRVATVDGRRVPHVVPVCHVLRGGRVYFGTEKNARKARNVRATGRASVTADRYDENWSRLRGVTVEGKAEIVTSGPRFTSAVRLLYAKYRQYEKSAALEPGESVVIQLTPSRVMSWGLGA